MKIECPEFAVQRDTENDCSNFAWTKVPQAEAEDPFNEM